MRLKKLFCISLVAAAVFAPLAFAVASFGLVEAMRFYAIALPQVFFVPCACLLSVPVLVAFVLPFAALAYAPLSRRKKA